MHGATPRPPSAPGRAVRLVPAVLVAALVAPIAPLPSASLADERTAGEAAPVRELESLLDTLGEAFGELDPKPAIRVDGLPAPEARAAEAAVTAALEAGDLGALIDAVERHALRLDFEASSDRVIALAALDGSPPDAELQRALESNDLDAIAERLAEPSFDVDAYLDLGEGVILTNRFTPLLVAVHRGHVEAVRLLLEAGADPDRKDELELAAPLFHALNGDDVAVARALLEAGATLVGKRFGTLPSLPALSLAVRNGSPEMLELLLEHGARPDEGDMFGWTPLMDALHAGRVAMARTLLPISDPRAASNRDIGAGTIEKPLGRPFHPKADALFVARLAGPPASDLEPEILARARTLGGGPAVALMRLRAADATARLAEFEGRARDGLGALADGLSHVDAGAFDGTEDAELVELAMDALVRKHELHVVTGTELPADERRGAERIEALGGWHGRWHDMLDAVAAAGPAGPGDPEEVRRRLAAWREAHGPPSHEGWNWTLLNEWAEGIGDESVRDRVFDTLDFFELN